MVSSCTALTQSFTPSKGKRNDACGEKLNSRETILLRTKRKNSDRTQSIFLKILITRGVVYTAQFLTHFSSWWSFPYNAQNWFFQAPKNRNLHLYRRRRVLANRNSTEGPAKIQYDDPVNGTVRIPASKKIRGSCHVPMLYTTWPESWLYVACYRSTSCLHSR